MRNRVSRFLTDPRTILAALAADVIIAIGSVAVGVAQLTPPPPPESPQWSVSWCPGIFIHPCLKLIDTDKPKAPPPAKPVPSPSPKPGGPDPGPKTGP